MMFCTGMSIKNGPELCALALRSKNNPQQFAGAFARACFNLRDRDKRPRRPGCYAEMDGNIGRSDPRVDFGTARGG